MNPAAPVSPATPVLLSGNMCDARLWSAALLEALPGAVDADLTRDDRIEAMAARVLAAHRGPLLPVGFSMGGIVALAMARLAPERLAGIVLLGTNPGADLPERAAARPAQQARVRAGGLDALVVDTLMPHYFAAARAEDADLRARVRAMAKTLGPEVFLRQSEALRNRPDQSAVLPGLEVPVLLACGAEDRLCPPSWHRAMAETARHPALHIVDNAGHMLPMEQPECLAAIIAAWRAACGWVR